MTTLTLFSTYISTFIISIACWESIDLQKGSPPWVHALTVKKQFFPVSLQCTVNCCLLYDVLTPSYHVRLPSSSNWCFIFTLVNSEGFSKMCRVAGVVQDQLFCALILVCLKLYLRALPLIDGQVYVFFSLSELSLLLSACTPLYVASLASLLIFWIQLLELLWEWKDQWYLPSSYPAHQ